MNLLANPLQVYQNQMQNLQSQLNQIGQSYQQPVNSQTIQYVNGKQSAEAYQMNPNSTVLLMDKNEPKFYIKQSDASGFCTTRTFTFEEVTEDQLPAVVDNYVTKEEFNSLKQSFEDLKKELM